MNFLARVITKRSIKEVLKVIETYFLGPTNDLIFGSISPLVLGGVGIPRFDSPRSEALGVRFVRVDSHDRKALDVARAGGK